MQTVVAEVVWTVAPAPRYPPLLVQKRHGHYSERQRSDMKKARESRLIQKYGLFCIHNRTTAIQTNPNIKETTVLHEHFSSYRSLLPAAMVKGPCCSAFYCENILGKVQAWEFSLSRPKALHRLWICLNVRKVFNREATLCVLGMKSWASLGESRIGSCARFGHRKFGRLWYRGNCTVEVLYK